MVRLGERDVAGEVGAVLEEPSHPLGETWEALENRFVEHRARHQREQPHHRTYAERNHAPAHLELVVIEAVLRTPEARTAERVHGVYDGDEVLEVLGRHVLAGRILARQLERHLEERHAEEAHPRRPIGLLEGAGPWQGMRAIEHADVVEAEESAPEEVV